MARMQELKADIKEIQHLVNTWIKGEMGNIHKWRHLFWGLFHAIMDSIHHYSFQMSYMNLVVLMQVYAIQLIIVNNINIFITNLQ